MISSFIAQTSLRHGAWRVFGDPSGIQTGAWKSPWRGDGMGKSHGHGACLKKWDPKKRPRQFSMEKMNDNFWTSLDLGVPKKKTDKVWQSHVFYGIEKFWNTGYFAVFCSGFHPYLGLLCETNHRAVFYWARFGAGLQFNSSMIYEWAKCW